MEEYFDCYFCQEKVSERERVRCFVENQVPRIPAKSFHKECFLKGLKENKQIINCRKCKKEITSADFKCGYLTGVYFHSECYKKIPKCGFGRKIKLHNKDVKLEEIEDIFKTH